jgi:hypothetical protein
MIIRLLVNDKVIQIDTLLLTPYINLLIEIKHNEKEERMKNPISQVLRQQNLLSKWLQQHKFQQTTIKFLIVNSNPYTILKSEQLKNNFIHAENLLESIEKIITKYQKPLRTPRDLRSITQKLITEHTLLSVNLLEEYDIPYDELSKGVYCPACHHRSKNAHQEALEDFFILVKERINNREVCDFLLISSRHTA